MASTVAVAAVTAYATCMSHIQLRATCLTLAVTIEPSPTPTEANLRLLPTSHEERCAYLISHVTWHRFSDGVHDIFQLQLQVQVPSELGLNIGE